MRTTKASPQHSVPGVAAADAEPEESKLWRWVPAVIICLGLVAVAVAVYLNRSVSGTVERADTAESRLVDTAAQASTLADQIKAECAADRLSGPVCETAAQVAAQPIPGPAGAQGPVGPAGRDGVDGLTPACLSEPNRCRGADGQPGQQGPAGAAGPAGPQGAAGPAGRDGTPAQSYTATYPDGSVQQCSRRAGTPDTAPAYDCTVTGPES